MPDLMTDDEIDALVIAGTRLLGIAVAPEWRATVRTNLFVSLSLGALVAGFDLPDEAEPAPVFVA
jgi:hypothetical protein